MKITLRLKFITLTTVLVTLIMISVTYFFNFREKGAKQASVAAQISRIARNIATMQLLDRQDWSVYQNYITRLMDFNKDLVYIAIYDDRNALRAHALNTDLVEINSPVLTRSRKAAIVRRLDRGAIAPESRGDLRVERVNIQVGERVLGSVHVGASLIHLNNDLRRGVQLNALLALFFIIVFSILSALFSRRLTRNVERLNDAIEAVNKGNLNQTVEIRSHDELAVLGKSFNEMVTGLRERKIIDKLGSELSATIQLTRLGPLVRDRLKKSIGARSAHLYIKLGADSAEFSEITAGDGKYPSIHLPEKVREFLKTAGEYFLIQDAPAAFREMLSNNDRREQGLVIPLTLNKELFGLLIALLPPGREQFSSRQINFALTLAKPAAIALENAILYRGVREQERMKRELEIARDVQRKLLPDRMPVLKGFAVDGICLPAQEVGGDYFDFFRLDENHLGIVIADVSGEGTSASFYMAEIKGMMLTLSAAYKSPAELLCTLNRKLYGNIDHKSFVTMLYGVLNLAENSFTFARAGHTPLIQLKKDQPPLWLTPPGLGLGLERGILFNKLLREKTIFLSNQDRLIFFTDGLVEAMNSRQEEFGEERLISVLNRNMDGEVSQTRREILSSIDEFVAGASVHDDITLVILQNLKEVQKTIPRKILQKSVPG